MLHFLTTCKYQSFCISTAETGQLHFLGASIPHFMTISGHFQDALHWCGVSNLCEKYPNVCVCSQHFQSEDFEMELKSQLMGLPCCGTLKSDAIPMIFPFTSKRKASDQPTSAQQKKGQGKVANIT